MTSPDAGRAIDDAGSRTVALRRGDIAARAPQVGKVAIMVEPRLHAIVETAVDGIILMDPGGTVSFERLQEIVGSLEAFWFSVVVLAPKVLAEVSDAA